jgi:hypothetical protein
MVTLRNVRHWLNRRYFSVFFRTFRVSAPLSFPHSFVTFAKFDDINLFDFFDIAVKSGDFQKGTALTEDDIFPCFSELSVFPCP